jgi:hypothetical protein
VAPLLLPISALLLVLLLRCCWWPLDECLGLDLDGGDVHISKALQETYLEKQNFYDIIWQHAVWSTSTHKLAGTTAAITAAIALARC